MRNPLLAAYRQRAVARAQGEVLEIGMGSGLNLPFYGHDVRRVLGLEPCLPLVRLARQEARGGNHCFNRNFLLTGWSRC
jgi:protein-L-isoaspartate O-methyltransferase